jgi:hypothetical protein
MGWAVHWQSAVGFLLIGLCAGTAIFFSKQAAIERWLRAVIAVAG